ncbi:MAG: hypothetical protein NVV59_19510 [Chitinophagaceae bacterium]|nr:hypothetical protein [Chitinophagaceae bacterium]
MKLRIVIQVMLLVLAFCASVLVFSSSSRSSASEIAPGVESLEEGKSQAREVKMIWEGLSGQFHSAL